MASESRLPAYVSLSRLTSLEGPGSGLDLAEQPTNKAAADKPGAAGHK